MPRALLVGSAPWAVITYELLLSQATLLALRAQAALPPNCPIMVTILSEFA